MEYTLEIKSPDDSGLLTRRSRAKEVLKNLPDLKQLEIEYSIINVKSNRNMNFSFFDEIFYKRILELGAEGFLQKYNFIGATTNDDVRQNFIINSLITFRDSNDVNKIYVEKVSSEETLYEILMGLQIILGITYITLVILWVNSWVSVHIK